MGGKVSSLWYPDDPDETIVPADYVTPPFPSLYVPSLINTKTEVGIFLYQAEDIWHFTLYWTVLLLGGIFLICSLFAVLTTLLSIMSNRKARYKSDPIQPDPEPDPGTNILQYRPGPPQPYLQRTRPKRGRATLWPLVLIPVVMVAIAIMVAVVTGTVVGFSLAAVYSAGGFTMSTWVPFMWALIEVVVLIVSSYATLTSIL